MKNYLVISHDSGDEHIGEILTITARSKDHALNKAYAMCPHACGFDISEYTEDDEV